MTDRPNPRPDYCCGVCPETSTGYDCTCRRNRRCPIARTQLVAVIRRSPKTRRGTRRWHVYDFTGPVTRRYVYQSWDAARCSAMELTERGLIAPNGLISADIPPAAMVKRALGVTP